VQQAKEFFAKTNEQDGLPPVGADAKTVLEAAQALFTSGAKDAMDRFLSWQAKDREGAKSVGKALGRKTECPLTKDELDDFAASGQTLKLEVFGTIIECEARQFATGSYGFGGSGKAKLTIAGKTVQIQCTPNFAIIGSALVK
jgi:hypothetical protein